MDSSTRSRATRLAGGALAATAWQLVVLFPGTDNLCVTYDLTLPLGAGTTVTRTELPTCPDLTRPSG